jgi:hypothetical protein
MILLTTEGDKLYCSQTVSPKINKYFDPNWDSLEAFINETKVKMYFTNKNSRSYFYFNMFDIWYKTKMVTDKGFDVMDYMMKNKCSFIYSINKGR